MSPGVKISFFQIKLSEFRLQDMFVSEQWQLSDTFNWGCLKSFWQPAAREPAGSEFVQQGKKWQRFLNLHFGLKMAKRHQDPQSKGRIFSDFWGSNHNDDIMKTNPLVKWRRIFFLKIENVITLVTTLSWFQPPMLVNIWPSLYWYWKEEKVGWSKESLEGT